MANYNEHKCLTCGKIFEYCRRCAITPVVYKAEGFCSEQCSDIFNILSKHGCNLITEEEVIAALSIYDIDATMLKDDIVEHINKIKSVFDNKKNITVASESVVEETAVIIEDVTTVKKSNKKK